MPSARGIRAGAAYIELYAHDNRLIRGMRRAERRLKAFGKSVSAIGRRMMGLGAVLAAPFAIATRTYAKFSDTMSAVKAITGATAEEFEGLRDQAKELGRTTSFTASQVAGAQVELGRMGFKSREIEDAIPGILNLARATGTELPSAAAIAAAALRGFQMDASETGRVADILSATANNSSQTLEDIGEAMKMVAPIAKEAGASIEDTASALGILANNGIKGTMAGTALARAYKNIAAGKGAKIFKDLSIETADANGNLRPLSEMLTELGEKTKHMGSAERLRIFETIFGRAQSAALKLASGTAAFDNLHDVLVKSAGTAKKTADVMDDNLGGSFRRLWSAVEGIQIAIGEVLDGALRDMSERLTQASAWVTKLVKDNRDLVVTVVAVVAGLLAAGAAFVVLGTMISSVGSVLGVFSGVITGVGTAIGVLGSVLAALVSPIGLVITAVVALGGYILYATGAGAKALGWLADKFGKLRDDAVEAYGGIANALAAGDIGLAAKILWLTLKMEWRRGVKYLKGIWCEVEKFALNVFYGMQAAWETAVHGIVVALIEGTAAMKQAWASFEGFRKKAVTQAGNWIAKQWTKLKSLFDDSIDVDAAVKYLDDMTETEIDDIDRETKRSKADIERNRATSREMAKTQHEEDLAEIGKKSLGLEDEYARKLKDSEAAIAKARAEWKAALNKAREKNKPKAETDEGPGKMEKPQELLDKVKESLAGLGDTLDRAAEKITVRGTFNAAAIRSLEAGTAADRTAKATEETAKNTKRIVKAAEEGGLVFS